MEVKIDIRGRINQWGTKSILGFASEDRPDFHHVVEISSKCKKELRRKHGSTTDFVEKFHCILITYAIKNYLNKISFMQICNDTGKKKLLKYLKDYLGSSRVYDNIKKEVRSVGKKAAIHKLLVRVGKKKHTSDLKLTPNMILKYLK